MLQLKMLPCFRQSHGAVKIPTEQNDNDDLKRERKTCRIYDDVFRFKNKDNSISMYTSRKIGSKAEIRYTTSMRTSEKNRLFPFQDRETAISNNQLQNNHLSAFTNTTFENDTNLLTLSRLKPHGIDVGKCNYDINDQRKGNKSIARTPYFENVSECGAEFTSTSKRRYFELKYERVAKWIENCNEAMKATVWNKNRIKLEPILKENSK